MHSIKRTFSALALSLIAAGCGGGGAGGGSSVLPPSAAGTAAVPAAGSGAAGTTTSPGLAPPSGTAGTALTSPNAVNVVTMNPAGRLPLSFQVGAMNVVQVMRTGSTTSTGALDVYPNVPVTPGNLLVAGISMSDGGESIIEQPSNWPPVDRVYYGSSTLGLAVFTHVVTAGDVGAPFHFIARPTGGTAPSSGVTMTGEIYEIAGANLAAPVDAKGTYSGMGGNSATTPTVAPTVNGTLPLAFLTEATGGTMPADYTGSSGWNGIYTIAFGQSYRIASQGLAATAPTQGTGGVAVTESWASGSGAQVMDLVLIAPGSGAAPPVPSAPATPSPSTPAPSTPPPSAPASGPGIVHTMVFYHGKDENTGIPAALLTQYADMVETDESPSYANAFMAAGGRQTVMYADPSLVPFCNYSNQCSGPMGSTSPESAWLHDASGNRLRTAQGQNALNPASSATQQSFHNYTAATIGSNNWTNVLMDDSNVDYNTDFLSYKFGSVPAEYAGLSNPAGTWLSGYQSLAAQATRPAIFNSGENDSAVDTFLRSSNVAGRMVEGCVVYDSGRVNLTDGNAAHTWAASLNKLLEATNVGKEAICMNYSVSGGDVVGDRLYAISSQWIAYDPNYSVTFPDYTTNDTYGGYTSKVFPEFQIVPTQPVQSPGSDVHNLQSSSGTFVREFRACYQNGSLIGACAAVVNPDGYHSRGVPALSRSYSRQLTVNTHSAVNGGTATWLSGTPSSLAPTTGAILLQ